MMMKSIIGALMIGLAPVGLAVAQDVPAGYPADYAKTIEAAKAEGKVLVYSNMSASQWAPFLELAKETYPWLTIETTDMSEEMWEKYYAENGSSVETADLMLTNSIAKWPEFSERGEVAQYESPELASLPDWSTPYPGVYTVSVDPTIFAYNRFLVPEDKVPHSRKEALELVKNTPELQGKVTTIDPKSNGLAQGAFYTLLKAKPEEWELIKGFAPYMRPERSAATVREKLMSGEYAIALMSSGGGIPRFEEPDVKKLVGWHFPTDGVPASMRNIAITKGASHPNAAKVMLDLILSKPGQIAMGKGGQTPYRADIGPDEAPYVSYNSVKEQVGAENIILIRPDADFAGTMDSFLAKWDAAISQ